MKNSVTGALIALKWCGLCNFAWWHILVIYISFVVGEAIGEAIVETISE